MDLSNGLIFCQFLKQQNQARTVLEDWDSKSFLFAEHDAKVFVTKKIKNQALQKFKKSGSKSGFWS